MASRAGKEDLLRTASSLALAVLLFSVLVVFVGSAQQATRQQMEEEIDAESRTFCESMGRQPGTVEFGHCAAMLNDLRARHDRRIAESLPY